MQAGQAAGRPPGVPAASHPLSARLLVGPSTGIPAASSRVGVLVSQNSMGLPHRYSAKVERRYFTTIYAIFTHRSNIEAYIGGKLIASYLVVL